MTPRETQPPAGAELSPERLQKKYDAEIKKHLEHMDVAETSAHWKEAEETRTRIEANFGQVLMLLESPPDDTVTESTHERIVKLWQEIAQDLSKIFEIQARDLADRVAARKTEGGEKKTMPELVEQAFGDEGYDVFKETLGKIAEGIEDDIMNPTSKRYFPAPLTVNGAQAAKDIAYIDKLYSSPGMLDPQKKVLSRLKSALQEIGRADKPGYERGKRSAYKDTKKRPNALVSTLQMLGLAGASVMTLLSMRSKNIKLTALYGGIAVALARPDFFEGADTKTLRALEVLKTPEGQRVLALKGLSGKDGRAAYERFCKLTDESEGDERAVLKAMLAGPSATMAQAEQLTGDKNNALYKLLAELDTDAARCALLRELAKITNKGARAVYADIIEEKGGTI